MLIIGMKCKMHNGGRLTLAVGETALIQVERCIALRVSDLQRQRSASTGHSGNRSTAEKEILAEFNDWVYQMPGFASALV